jgi:hypothetical protein
MARRWVSPRQRFRAFHVKVNCCGAVRVKAKDFGRTFRGYSSRLLVTDARLEEFRLSSKHHCSTFPEFPFPRHNSERSSETGVNPHGSP